MYSSRVLVVMFGEGGGKGQEAGGTEQTQVLCRFTNSHASWRVRTGEPMEV